MSKFGKDWLERVSWTAGQAAVGVYAVEVADRQAAWPETFNPTLPSPNAWGGPPNFWQFSSTFPRGQDSLDADVFDGTLAQLRALNTGG